MTDLINDMYSVYDPDPAYCFLSIDVIKMFDEIPMSAVCNVIKALDAQVDFGCYVNISLLLDLVSLDCDLFNYFQYYDIPILGDEGNYLVF